MKLGKLAAKKDVRTFRLARTTPSHTLPAPSLTVNLTRGQTNFGVMVNDVLGCCTISGLGHGMQIWTSNTSEEITLTDEQIIKYYSIFDGYKAGDPSTDNGGIELDVLNQFKQYGIEGHTLLAYADPDPLDLIHVKQSIPLFGGLYIGLALPLTAQNQKVWDVVGDPHRNKDSAPFSWGGHAVWITGYDETGFYCITWGEVKKMTNDFWVTYVDEAHALLSADWLPHFGGNTSLIQPLMNALLDVKA